MLHSNVLYMRSVYQCFCGPEILGFSLKHQAKDPSLDS